MHRKHESRHGWPRARRLGPAGLLWILLPAAAGVNCRCDKTLDPPGQQQPPVTHEVPLIRVRLTGSPVAEATVATTGGYRLSAGGRVLAGSAAALPAVTVRREGDGWRVGSLTAGGTDLVIAPTPGGQVRLAGTTYRGSLRLLAVEADRFLVINHVELEHYLAGVLSKELYAGWAPQTYRALAVAARTFAMYQMISYGKAHEYDLGDDQGSQVYQGLSAETPKSREAVDATYGTVLSHGQPGAERIFLTQYSACCGGRVNGAYVIRRANRIAPLEGGQVCTDCSACRQYHWAAVRIGKADIHRALAARYRLAASLRDVAAIKVATKTPYGRAVWVDVFDTAGKKIRLRAEDVRLSMLMAGVPAAKRLYSMNCRLRDVGSAIEFHDGRGFGHGVGLCQWGAQGKALAGWTAERILAFYYPGAKLYRVH
jgi:stage II sporulation protein D